MNAPDPTSWRARADSIGLGETARIELRPAGRVVHGFVVNHDGRHHAYVNRCPHAGTPLDLWPNEFLSADGRELVCATHGAVFAPDTGECLAGPCPGRRLERLAVARDGDWLVVSAP